MTNNTRLNDYDDFSQRMETHFEQIFDIANKLKMMLDLGIIDESNQSINGIKLSDASPLQLDSLTEFVQSMILLKLKLNEISETILTSSKNSNKKISEVAQNQSKILRKLCNVDPKILFKPINDIHIANYESITRNIMKCKELKQARQVIKDNAKSKSRDYRGLITFLTIVQLLTALLSDCSNIVVNIDDYLFPPAIEESVEKLYKMEEYELKHQDDLYF